MASKSDEIWGTWEDLIVAKLVAHNGPRWDIVAAELRKRVSPAAASNFTPQNCQERFNILRRRFAPDDPDIDGGVFPRDIPWTEELRFLRLEQLHRELENSGVSLGALGLKFNQMKEERKRKAAASRKLDLKAASSGSGARDSVSGGNSQSKPAVEEAPDPAAAGDDKAASCNGSTETIAKGEAEASLPADAGVGHLRELADSAAQSKEGEGEGDKENSDVHSLASVSQVFTLALAARPKLPPPDKESTQPLVSQLFTLALAAMPKLPPPDKESTQPLVLATESESKGEKDEKRNPDGDRKDSDGDDELLAKELSGTQRVRTTRSSAAALKAPIIARQLLALPPPPPPAAAPKLSPASGKNRPTPLAKPQKKSSGATSNAGSSLAKKRGAATSLNRIKEKSPPPSSPPLLPSTNLLESLKGASSSGNAGKGQEMKKAGEKGEGKKELAPRSRPSGKAAAEKGATVKRSVGRSSKRTAPPLTLSPAKRVEEEATVPPLPVKRVKEEVAATVTPPPMKDGEGGSSVKVTAATPPPIKMVKDGEGGSGSNISGNSPTSSEASLPASNEEGQEGSDSSPASGDEGERGNGSNSDPTSLKV